MRYVGVEALSVGVVLACLLAPQAAHAEQHGTAGEEASARVDDRAGGAADEGAGVPLKSYPYSIEAAGEVMRDIIWKQGLTSGSLAAVHLAAGGTLVAGSDSEPDELFFPGELPASTVREVRRWGLGLSMLAMGFGQLVGAAVTFATMPRHREPWYVRKRLRVTQALDAPWIRSLLVGGAVAVAALVGLLTYGASEDPDMQGIGLGITAQVVTASVSFGVGIALNNRLRPFYPLAGAARP